MPSEAIDSSSFFSKEISFSDERQLGFWKTDEMDKLNGAPGNSLFSNGFEHTNSDVSRDHRANSHLEMLAPSVGADNHHEEDESFESLKELEAKTIGDLLPDDDDLFYSVADKIDGKNHLISSHWGLGLDGQALEPNSTTNGDRPLGGHPSRSLFVQNIDSNLHDAELLALFGRYGDISTLYTKCKNQGFIMVSYYDIRAACNAMNALQNSLVLHGKLDIHFYNPKENRSENDVDQGTLVVFNVDSSVSCHELHQIFGVYGEVKEIREAPNRSHQKIIEFYDVRAADAALCALNRSDIAGNKTEFEASHPAGARGISRGGTTPNSGNGTVLSARSSGRPPISPCWENGFSGHNRSQSLLNLGPLNNQSNSMKRSNSHGQINFNIWGAPDCPPDSQDSFAYGSICKSPGNMTAGRVARPSEFQENSFGRVSPREHPIEWNENVFSASPNGNCPSPGQNYMWNNTSPQPSPQSRGNIWPNSPSFPNGTFSPRPQQMSNHLVGSPRSGNPSLWERRHGYAAEQPETSVFNSGSLGGLNIPGNSPGVMELIPHNMFSCNGGSPMEIVHSPNVNQTFLVVPTRGPFSPVMSPFTSPNERTRGRKSDASSSQGDNKQFELDIDRIMQGEEKRTTLMIKNIPNKYTSKMLLATIDEHHKGTYDFLYLPIDFKNKCNVGYAFINMTEPSFIVPLYQSLNGKKWEKFNSEKVASIAYARIQGKAALISHFQNSSLMNEDKRCRPMLFLTDGPNAGDQVPFPTPTTNRSRGSRMNSPSSEEHSQETLPDHADEKENSCLNSFPETSLY